MDMELLELQNANAAADAAYAEMDAAECHDCCLHRDACEQMWARLTAECEIDPRRMGCGSCTEWEER